MAEKIIPPIPLNFPGLFPLEREILYRKIVALGNGHYLRFTRGINRQDDPILFNAEHIRPTVIPPRIFPLIESALRLRGRRDDQTKDRRKLSNVGEVLLEWAFDRLKEVDRLERLIKLRTKTGTA